MRLLLRLRRGLISGTALALAGCAEAPADPDPQAAAPGGPSPKGEAVAAKPDEAPKPA